MVRATAGTELMNQLATGELQYKQSNIALELKEGVSQALEAVSYTHLTLPTILRV